jgi:hypothetical protein
MTVTVVRGFVGKSGSSTPANQPSKDSAPSPTAVSQAQAAVNSVVASTSEAAVATIRLSKSITVGDKVRDAREARELTDDIAERVSDEDSDVDAHSELSPVSARHHFS